MPDAWKLRFLLDIEPELKVFKNHHDNWSYLAQATTVSGVNVTIKGWENRKRDAKVSGERALTQVHAVCHMLEHQAFCERHEKMCEARSGGLCTCGADER